MNATLMVEPVEGYGEVPAVPPGAPFNRVEIAVHNDRFVRLILRFPQESSDDLVREVACELSNRVAGAIINAGLFSQLRVDQPEFSSPDRANRCPFCILCITVQRNVKDVEGFVRLARGILNALVRGS